MSGMEELTGFVLAIKEDPDLRKAFVQVLEMGTSTQQARVAKIHEALQAQHREVDETMQRLIRFLSDDKVAGLVLNELKK